MVSRAWTFVFSAALVACRADVPDAPDAPDAAGAAPRVSLEQACAIYTQQTRRRLGDAPVSCAPTAWTGKFRGDARWRNARAVRVRRGDVDEARLAVELPRGWVVTPIAWDEQGGHPMDCPGLWVPKEVPYVTVESGYLVAYVDGETRVLVHPQPQPNDTGWRLELQRGLTWCNDTGSELTCKTHDPRDERPLDTKRQPRSQPLVPWSALEWSGGRDFHVEADGGLRIFEVLPVRAPRR